MKRAPQRPAAMALVLPTIIVPGAEGKLPPPPPARPAPSSAGTLGRAGGQKGPRSASADVISQRRQRAPCLVPAGRPPAAAHARAGPLPYLSPRVLLGGGSAPKRGVGGLRHDTTHAPPPRSEVGAKPPAPRPAGRDPPAARRGQAGLGPQARKTELKKEEKQNTAKTNLKST